MHPLFFGNQQQLYGVYHMPEPDRARPLGVVLCQPVFHECADARRAMRSLADLFAEAGIHALRFDYRGTGDSAGDLTDDSLEEWTEDVNTAIEELAASRGLDSVGLVGLRFGASLAARAATQAELPFMVLWQPIVEGAPWLQTLRQLQANWVKYEADQRPAAKAVATPDEIVGYSLPSALADRLTALDICKMDAPGAERVLLIEEQEESQFDALHHRLEDLGVKVDRHRGDGGRVWHRDFDAEQAQVPRELLEKIVGWAAEGSAQ